MGDAELTGRSERNALELLVDDALADLLSALPGATTTTTLPPASCDTLPDCDSCVSCALGNPGPCVAEISACLDDTNCAALYGCLNLCPPGDSFCLGNCFTTNPGGVTLFNAIDACVGATCTTTCGP